MKTREIKKSRRATIESSDSSLLRVSEGVEGCIDRLSCGDSGTYPESRVRSQRFDVLGTGAVTLTFKDGDELILSREVQLMEASSLKLSRPSRKLSSIKSVQRQVRERK